MPTAIVESGNIPAPAFGAEKAHDIDARCRLSGEVAPIELSIGTRGERASADLTASRFIGNDLACMAKVASVDRKKQTFFQKGSYKLRTLVRGG